MSTKYKIKNIRLQETQAGWNYTKGPLLAKYLGIILGN